MRYVLLRQREPRRGVAGAVNNRPIHGLFPVDHQRLQVPAYKGLWQGGSIYFMGNAMQAMAAARLMVEITGSSFLAALVQTAVSLPMVLLSLPAGVMADSTERRRLIVAALIVQAATVSLLAGQLLAGVAGSSTLLFLTFVASSCTALLFERLGVVCDRLGVLARVVGHRRPVGHARHGGGGHGRRAAAGPPVPAAHERSA